VPSFGIAHLARRRRFAARGRALVALGDRPHLHHFVRVDAGLREAASRKGFRIVTF
jgi:hypothetical protein